MKSPLAGRGRSLVAVSAVVALAIAPPALGAGVTKARAQAIAKRAASDRVQRFGITYPLGAWRADCQRRAAGWRCAVGTGGQCSGTVTVTGSDERPRARRVDVWCFG
jgi:hypothetical protein